MRLTAEIRFRNAKVLERLRERGLTLMACAREIIRLGLSGGSRAEFSVYSHLCAIVSLRGSKHRGRNKWPPAVRRLAEGLASVLGLEVEDVLPRQLVEAQQTLPTLRITKDVDVGRLIEMRNPLQIAAPADTVEAKDTAEQLAKRLEQVLDTLTFREREIVKLRYGIGDVGPFTLEEVGRIFGIHRERVRAIEAKAIRRLQHPKRSRVLEDLADWADEEAPAP